MIAALPMYDWPSLAAAHDALWAGIRGRLRAAGRAAPEALDRGIGLWEGWLHPRLVLGQTCGMPYRTRLHGQVVLVGTPDYGLPEAPSGHYYSQLVVRRGAGGTLADFAERTLAFNGHDSQSGWAAPQNQAAVLGFRFRRTLHTGAHRDSALAVAGGRADIAAIDAVTWRILGREMPEVAAALEVIGHTDPTPGLPLIAAAGTDPVPLAEAVAGAIGALEAADRDALGLTGLAQVPAAAYLAVPNPPPPSQDTPRN